MHHARDRAVHLAAHQAVHHDAPVPAAPAQPAGDGEGGGLDDALAQQQDLRQCEHDKENGDHGAAAKALADADDGALGADLPQDEAGGREDGAGGQNGGESEVHRVDDGLPALQCLPRFHIAAGDHDGVVDVGAHLDRGDDEVGDEKQVHMGEHRHGEVDPDGALDHQDEQQRHRHGLEGEQQHHQHDEDAHHADHHVVPGKGFLKLIGVCGVAHHVDAPVGIVRPGDLGDQIGEGIGLIAALRQVQIDQHPAEVLALELGFAVLHAVGGAAQRVLRLLGQGDIAVLHPVPDEQEHVDERDGIGGHAAHQLSVFLPLRSVGGVNELAELIVDVRQLGKLSGGQPVGQRVAVHGLDVAQAHGAFDLRHGVQLRQDRPLGFIVPGGDHQGNQIGRGKVVPYHPLGHLLLVQLGRHDGVIAVDIGAALGDEIAADDQRQEEDRHHHAAGIGKAPHEGDLGNKVPVLRLFDPGPEEHQKAGHEDEHGKQGEKDRLDEADAHVRAKAELHEDHRHQTAHRGEAAGADFRDALAQRLDDRLAQRQGLVLLLESVAQDHRVVQRQRQLQNAGHGVGDEGDLAQKEVGAHIQHHGADEGQQQHGDLRPGLAGQRQHRDDDERHDDHDDVDLGLDDLRQLVAEAGVQIGVIGAVARQHRVQRVQAGRVLLRIGEGDVIEGGDIVIVVRALVKAHALHALHAAQLLGDLVGAGVGHAGDHQLGRAEGGKLLRHAVQALPRLRLGGQIGRQVVFHLDPVAGHGGKNQPQRDQQKDQIALVYNKGCELYHEACTVLLFIRIDAIIPHTDFEQSFQKL